jgi:hypothetical protein
VRESRCDDLVCETKRQVGRELTSERSAIGINELREENIHKEFT